MNLILTIDDGPSTATLERIRILKDKRIRVIWFCAGALIERNYKNAVAIVEAGHVLANHARSHFSFSEISTRDCLFEIRKTEDIIQDVYHSAGEHREKKYFRFPFGDQGIGTSRIKIPFRSLFSKWQTIQYELKHIGMIPMRHDCQNLRVKFPYSLRYKDYDWIWTLDSKDWKTTQMCCEEFINFFKKTIETVNNRKSDQVILCHDDPNLLDQFEYFINEIT